jgi:hypothetical protein
MAIEDPQIPGLGERRAGRNLGHHICWVVVAFGRLLE